MFSSAITQYNDVIKQNTNKYAINYTVPQCNNKRKRSLYRVFGLVRKHGSRDHFYTSVYHNTHVTAY